MSTKPLVIIHGWSDSAESFRRLAGFFTTAGGRDVSTISLADWVSLNDEVSYADLAHAMQRAWREKRLPTTPRSVDIVVHSTGALVVRQWLTAFYEPDDNPVDHLLMLAPANYGSPLAHKGRAFYGRILKGWRSGFQTGARLLQGLELGSAYTFQLAMKDVLSRRYWYGANRIKATVLVGNEGYGGVRAAANEDGGDGTVRIATANLDTKRLTVDYSRGRDRPRWRLVAPARGYRTAFAIVEGDNHGTIVMNEDGTPRNERARALFLRAVTIRSAAFDAWCDELDALRRAVESTASPRRGHEHHVYHHAVTRVFDDVGNPVPEYFVEFYERDSDTSAVGRFFHRDAIRTVHRPGADPNHRSFYIDTTLLASRIDKDGLDRLEIAVGAEPRVGDHGAAAPGVGYDRRSASHALAPHDVRTLFTPNATLLIDLVIERKMQDVFRLVAP